MAVRDRNLFAWQAYVITMSIVSVGLLLGMFFLWRGYSDLDTRFQDSQASKTTAEQNFTTSEARVDRLLSMMGYGNYTDADLTQMADKFKADEKLATAESDYQQAMTLFAGNSSKEDQNLMKLPQFLIDTVRTKNDELDEKKTEIDGLKTQLEDTVSRERQNAKQAEDARDKAEADLAKARQDHSTEVARLNTEKDEAVRMYDSYRSDMEKRLATLQAENGRLVAQSAKQLETIQVQMDIINQFRNPDFAAPQGEVLRVANGGRDLWLNLGRADGLREGVPFSVIDESEINISNATPKAKLVVTRIVDEHLCHAELTEAGDYRNPVVPGDKVYSPAWRPGRKVSFALVGLMDINDDTRSDLEQVRELIRLSGGVVDAEMDVSGGRTGTLSPNTSFLVLGTDLTISANASPDQIAEQKTRVETYAKFITEARQNGIIQISLDKLMGYLKTEGADRTIPLGSRIQSSNFPIKPMQNPPVSRGSVSDIYTPRTP